MQQIEPPSAVQYDDTLHVAARSRAALWSSQHCVAQPPQPWQMQVTRGATSMGTLAANEEPRVVERVCASIWIPDY